MKCTIPEIAWHNKDPVLSIDIQPIVNEYYRLASGGTDCHILIWHLKIKENETVNLEVVSDLTRHQRAVNVVRWSCTGQYLASADDDANIIIWNLKVDNVPLLDETTDKEIWIVHKVLRGHKEDVYDLCWSPDELKLVSGSIDNTAVIWDLKKGKMDHIITTHKGFVQGVSWDPKGDYIATLCSDRMCRIFDSSGKQVLRRIGKGLLPVSESHPLFNKEVKYYHDDTFKSYFRRLTFSPDGNLLITPSGCVETDECNKALNATYIFTLQEIKQPAAVLPTLKQNTIAVRCCPILFELRPDGPKPLISLPYRMIIAVATDSDVILYDTQQEAPFAHLQKIHYTRLTDLTWSSDGLILACSSTDGFCTLVTFAIDELGVQYKEKEIETNNIMEINKQEDKEKLEPTMKEPEKEIKPKKPNLLEQWAMKSPKESISSGASNIKHKQLIKEKVANIAISDCIDITNSPEKVPNDQKVIETKTPKRIVPIKIGECNTLNLKKRKLSDFMGDEKNAYIEKETQIEITKNQVTENVNTRPIMNEKNSILKFLKPSGKTPKKKKDLNNPIDKTIITAESETEARDAWKCETQTSNVISIVDNNIDLTDDIPDDFQLQLTDSNSVVLNNDHIGKTDENKQSISEELREDCIKKSNENRENHQSVNAKEDDKTLSAETNNDKINSESKEITKVSDSPQIKAKGRRVPLITISGPKTKLKKDA